MTCNEIENRLPAYLEDLLPPEEMKRIAAHLAACECCNRTLDDLKKVDSLVKGLPEVEPPPFFEQRIMAQVRVEAGRKRGLLHRFFQPLRIKLPIQALATLLIAVLAFYVYEQGGPEMKRMAPPPVPATEFEQGRVTGESRPVAPSADSAAVSARRAPGLGKGPAAAASVPPPDSVASARLLQAPELGNAPMTPESAPVPAFSSAASPSGDLSEKAGGPPAALASGGEEKASGRVESQTRRREEGAATTGPPAPVMTAREAAVAPVGVEVTGKPEQGTRPPAYGVIEAPPSAQMRKGQASNISPAAEESGRGPSSPGPSTPAAGPGGARQTVDLVIGVRDLDAAIQQTESLLGRFNARIVEREHLTGSGLLRVEMAGRDVAAFLERIAAIGQVNLETRLDRVPAEVVTVNLTIVIRQ